MPTHIGGPQRTILLPLNSFFFSFQVLYRLDVVKGIPTDPLAGNPGLIEFYTPFLQTLYHKDTTGRIAILAHGHIDHTPLPRTQLTLVANGLTIQVQSAIEAFDALTATYTNRTKFIIIGHSVGSWICTQILKARRDEVFAAFLLFPTISFIADTPNGRRLSHIFKPAATRWAISCLGYVACLLPVQLLSVFYPEWPRSQLQVLKDLIGSPRCIAAALRMANDEMEAIRELDVSLLESCKEKLHFYYASQDDWVGEERHRLLKALHPIEPEIPVKVVHDEHGIPHAFCINHGDQLAGQCLDWLNELNNDS